MTPAARQVGLITGTVVLGMSPWFSATVVAGAMRAEWQMSAAAALWLTLAVQGGFVAGSLVSAIWLLSDRWQAHRLAGGCAVVAAAATAALTLPGVGPMSAIALRFVAGAALAGVYPPAIKLAAGWTQRRRGLAIGALVGGISLGSAAPHLLRLGVPMSAWREVQWLAAGSALVAAVFFLRFVRPGPWQAPSAPFSSRALRQVLGDRRVMLATGGYLGHMWELYAMWSSIGVFWTVIAAERSWGSWWGPLLAFVTVGAGAAGSLWAGVVADRVGRARTTIVAMGLSGACSLMIGPLHMAPAVLLVGLAIVWGATIVADSAQFSASVTEWSDSAYVGTAVTIQTALGFLLTMVTIGLVPRWVEAWGWQRAYMPLALGPVLGILCMARLRHHERVRTLAMS